MTILRNISPVSQTVVDARGISHLIPSTGSISMIATNLPPINYMGLVTAGLLTYEDAPNIVGDQDTTPEVAPWYDADASSLSILKLLTALTARAGVHTYTYDAGGNLLTDTWSVFGTSYVKSYTYASTNANANRLTEGDWLVISSISPAIRALTLVGQAVISRTNNRFLPAAGSIALAGNTPSWVVNRPFFPTGGAIGISAGAVTIARTYVTSPAVGSLAVTGQAVTKAIGP